jgi:hypothetical protein
MHLTLTIQRNREIEHLRVPVRELEVRSLQLSTPVVRNTTRDRSHILNTHLTCLQIQAPELSKVCALLEGSQAIAERIA